MTGRKKLLKPQKKNLKFHGQPICNSGEKISLSSSSLMKISVQHQMYETKYNSQSKNTRSPQHISQAHFLVLRSFNIFLKTPSAPSIRPPPIRKGKKVNKFTIFCFFTIIQIHPVYKDFKRIKACH